MSTKKSWARLTICSTSWPVPNVSPPSSAMSCLPFAKNSAKARWAHVVATLSTTPKTWPPKTSSPPLTWWSHSATAATSRANRSQNTAPKNVAVAASKPPPPRKTTGSSNSSLATPTITSCASPTAVVCTGSKFGKYPKVPAAHAVAPSSICFHCKRAKKSMWCCPLPVQPAPSLPTNMYSWRPPWARSKRPRWTSSTTHARAASLRSIWTTTTS